MDRHVDALYRIAHTAGSPAASAQAIMLLYNLAVGTPEEGGGGGGSGGGGTGDGGRKRGKGRGPKKANLLYKSTKNDDRTPEGRIRVVAFAEWPLRTSIDAGSPSVAAGAVFVGVGGGAVPGGAAEEGPPVRRGRGGGFVRRDQSAIRGRRSSAWMRRKRGTAAETANGTPSPTEAEEGSGIAGENAPSIGGLWEPASLNVHFHPSVSKFASSLPNHIDYRGDPLRDIAIFSAGGRRADVAPASNIDSWARRR